MCWVSKKGRAAKIHTTSQLLTVSRYMSRGRNWVFSGRPGITRARPATKVIMLAQRNEGMSWVRSKITSVAMGTTMLIASVIRKMPIMKPIIRRVGNAMRSALTRNWKGRHSTYGPGHVNGRIAVHFLSGGSRWRLSTLCSTVFPYRA
ncbi:hypothetical protein D9M73_212230 [compost metagenome]